MNLWVKRTGQFLLAALLLVSCEDDSLLLGFKNPNQKFRSRYQELLIGQWGETNVYAIDSVATDNLVGSRILVGKYNDPSLGTVEATGYVELVSATTKLASTSVYDSITFEMQIDFYSYGLNDEHIEKFAIHRLTEDTLTFYNSKRYYANSSVGYDPTPLGEASIKVNIDTLTKNLQKSSGYDTILARARLDDTFGQELFTVSLNDPNSDLTNVRRFKNRFKGLVLVPTTDSRSVLGYSPNNALSRVLLHYHTVESGNVKDTLVRQISMNGINFHNIKATRSGSYPASDPPYLATQPGTVAIQCGDAMVTKIDIRSFYEFADTIDNMIINSAEFVIEGVDNSDPVTYPLVSSLELRVAKENNHFFNDKIDSDSAALRNYYLLYDPFNTTDITNNFMVRGDYSSTASSAVLAYQSSPNKYSGFVTLFAQNLFAHKTDDTRIEYLTLYPNSSAFGIGRFAPGKTINRALFNKNNIKLRIFYTVANVPNL